MNAICGACGLQNFSCRDASFRTKAMVVALGILTVGAGVAMYLANVNAIASYAVMGVGGVATLAPVAMSVCKAEPTATLEFTSEGHNFTIGGSEIAEKSGEQIIELIKDTLKKETPSRFDFKLTYKNTHWEDVSNVLGQLPETFQKDGRWYRADQRRTEGGTITRAGYHLVQTR